MCVVSMIMDHYWDKWKPYYDPWKVEPYQPYVPPPLPTKPYVPVTLPTQDEIDEFRKLLERAREYDKKNNEPDCELEEKRQRLLNLAKELGVEIDFV